MSDNKKSGCVVAALVGVALLVGAIVLVVAFSFKAAKRGKNEIQAHFEQLEARADARAAEEQEKVAAAVQLREGELADYSSYRAGDPLSRELFLAWRLDQGATTLAKEVFVKNAEGAEVVWELQAGDLKSAEKGVTGDFYLPYAKIDSKGRDLQSGTERVECHFAEGTRDSLLGIRRGGVATLRGRLSSLVNNTVVLKDARLATEEVEK